MRLTPTLARASFSGRGGQLLAGLPVVLAALLTHGTALAADWPQMGLDAQRTRASAETSGASFELAWRARVSTAAIVGSPAVADGYVVVGARDGSIQALRAEDGSPLWLVDAADGVAASPAAHGGRVFVPTLGGKMLALRLGDGTKTWERAVGGQNYGSPIVDGDALVVAAGFPAQKLVRLRLSDGDVRWQSAPGSVADLVNSSPALAGADVLIGMNGGRYQSMSLHSGQTRWQLDTGGAVNLSAPLVLGQTAYLLPGGLKAALFAVDVSSGLERAGWPLAVSDPVAVPTGVIVARRYAVSSPVAAGDLVVFQIRFEYSVKPTAASPDTVNQLREYVVAVDPTGPRILWMKANGTSTARTINQVPELNLAPTPAVFASGAGALVAVTSSVAQGVKVLDAASGTELWEGQTGAPARSSAVLANGKLLVATDDGFVYAFRSLVNAAPMAPTGFSPADGQSVAPRRPRLSWSPASDVEDGPISYIVRLDTDGEVLETWRYQTETTAGTRAVVLPFGLAAGTYTYAVRARDAQGALSAWSPPQSFTVAPGATVRVGDSEYGSVEEAVAAAPADGEIRLGAGVVRLSSTLRLSGGMTLVGAGPHATVVDASGLATGIDVSAGGRSGPIEIRNVTVAGAGIGVKVSDASGAILRNVILRDHSVVGLLVAPGAAAEMVFATVVRNAIGAHAAGVLAVRNSIFASNTIGLASGGEGFVDSRYNNLTGNFANYDRVLTGQGDLSVEVAFASPEDGDFRLLAAQPTTDQGDPADECTGEPMPNGGRVNMGAFANSALAEPSPERPAQAQVAPAAASAPSIAAAAAPAQTTTNAPAAEAIPAATDQTETSTIMPTTTTPAAPTTSPAGPTSTTQAPQAAPSSAPQLLQSSQSQAAGCSVAASESGNAGGLALLVVFGALVGLRRRRAAKPGVGLIVALVAALLSAWTARAEAGVTRVQETGAATSGSATVVASWGTSTHAGALLVAVVAARGGSNTVITPPAGKGWLLAARKNNGTDIATAIYYIANAAPQSGNQSWGISGNAKCTLSMMEYSGIRPAAPVDLSTTASGSTSAATLTTSSAASQAAELAVGAVSSVGTPSFSGLTASFTRVSLRTSSSGSGTTRNRTETFERLFTGPGVVSASTTISGTSAWAGALVTFRAAARYWIGSTAGNCSDPTRWSLTSGGPNNATVPDADDTVIFDGNGVGSCTVTGNAQIDSIELASTYTGTVTFSPGITLVLSRDLTIAGGTFNAGGGAITTNGSGSYAGDITIRGGTFNGNGSAVTVRSFSQSAGRYNSGSGLFTVNGDMSLTGGTFSLGGQARISNTSGAFTQTGGTFDGGTGSATFVRAASIDGGTFSAGSAGTPGVHLFQQGLTIGAGGTLAFPADKGRISITAGKTLAVNGTLRSASPAGATPPGVESASAWDEYLFTVGGTAVLDLNGFEISGVRSTGVTVANGATFTSFSRVRFVNNAGGKGSKHLSITANALALVAPGCFFDTSARINVELIGNGDSDGRTTAVFDFRDAELSGPGAGDDYDADDDEDLDGMGDNPSTNGAVVQWMASAAADTSGRIEGFPTAAFDWNTFSWYGVYVAYRDIPGSGSADRIFVRTLDGEAAYSYDIPEADGNIIGTPRWDALSEVRLDMDINGDGDKTDTSVHVLYIPTTAGKVFKLIDTGSAIIQPTSGPWSTPFSSPSVTAITSALVSDGTNLYFGGVDALSVPKVLAVQIAAGPGEKTLVRSITSIGTIQTAPAWKAYNGTTYLFLGSLAVEGQAYLYRVEVAPGATVNAQCLSAPQDVNGSIRLSGDRAYAGDSGGRLHAINTAGFNAGGFANVPGFPFRDTQNHTVGALDAGLGAIVASPYIDFATNKVYVGDADGHLYVIRPDGTVAPGFPMRLSNNEQLNSSPLFSNGVIMVGTSGGKVFYIDQNTGSGSPSIFKRIDVGNVGISSIAYNGSKGQYMVATTGGQLYFIAAESDPTPAAN